MILKNVIEIGWIILRIKLFKVIVSVSVVMIALLTLSPTQIGATSTKDSILKENEVENSIQNTFVRKVAVKGVYYLLNKSTQALAKKTPTITSRSFYIRTITNY